MSDSSNNTYRGNMMCIKFSYDFKIILPIEDGKALLELLSKAELFKEEYQKEPHIEPMDKDIDIRFLARTTYERLKLNFLRSDNNEPD
ncbi:hypothetical protein CPT_Pollock40 [Escherichia phage Pollock]|uniref:Uncharacterized protein n=1 Tax=Escherichia phage Pollock TaxID=1540097 RepID=A0A0A0YPW2_9CAUD|nr:hypothetical protein ACQ44_gp40 [Escherichia phage Pollock]AIX12399.1 hypothetical protein CPT_Pollock40 [Escherichia phage Pollock]